MKDTLRNQVKQLKISMNKWIISLTCSLFFLSVAPVMLPPATASSALQAELPPFSVRLNGVEMDLAYSKYPFLYRNGITYMPLTWNYLQSLNIEYNWSEEDGLKIWPNRNYPPPIHKEPPEQELSEERNGSTFSVKQVEQRLSIASTDIESSTEPFPFLSFRDVVYMPLTWHYVHDLLNLEIRWSEEVGLQLIGGQNVMGDVAGEDDDALYFYSLLWDDPTKVILKMDKSSFSISWKSREAVEPLLEHARTAIPPLGGKPAAVTRKDRNLYYGDLLLYTLTDSDLWEPADYGPPVQTYTEYDAGKQGVIVTVNLKLQLPVIGPNYGTTYNFLIRNGTVSRLTEFNTRLSRVIPNPDGTVWITAARLPSRNGYMGGSARIALLNQEGQIQLVNEQLNESDVMALGLLNPDLPNPAGPDGSLNVVMFGYGMDWKEQDTAGLYTLNTRMETVRLTDTVAGNYYMDKSRRLYLLKDNNTIENVASHDIHSWFDYELVRMESR